MRLAGMTIGTIQAFLRHLKATRGRFALGDLRRKGLDVDAALADLTQVPGVGVKTAAITLMFGCGAIMGALYRSFSGLEPVPLPEAIIATDPNALVGADDPARHQHKVILSN